MKKIIFEFTLLMLTSLFMVTPFSVTAQKMDTLLPEEGRCFLAPAEAELSAAEPIPEQSIVIDYFSDTKRLVSSPLYWDKADWLKASLVLGTTIFLYQNDQATQKFFQDNRNQTTDGIANFVENLGDFRCAIPALGLIYIGSLSGQDEKLQQATFVSLESVIIANGFTGALKLASHRHRPKTGEPFETWDGPNLSVNDQKLSFPSSHSATSFAIATVFSTVYDDTNWVPYLSYSLATLTALSRINDNQHWSSDVFFGSAIGFFTAKAIMDYQPKTNYLTILPLINGQRLGMTVGYRF